MAQVTGSSIQTSGASASSQFLAALRAGLSAESVQNDMFADLLSQLSACTAQQKTNQELLASSENTSRNSPSDTSASDLLERSSDEDRAVLHDLLRKLREDAQALRQSLRRASDDHDDQKRADKKEDDRETCVADTSSTETKPVTEDTVSISEEASAQPDVEMEPTQTCAEEVPVETVKENASNEEKQDLAPTDETKNIIADMIQTEQAALWLLNKMMHIEKTVEKKSFFEKGETANATTAADAAAQLASALDAGTTRTNDAAPSFAGTLDTASPDDGLVLPDAMQNGTDGNNASPDPSLLQTGTGSKGEKPIESSLLTTSKADDFFNFFNNLTSGTAVSAPPALSTDLAAAIKNSMSTAITGISEASATTSTASQTTTSTTTPVLTEATKPAGSYDFASQLSATRATKGGATGLPQAVEQVALLLRKQAADGTDQMTLQLRPAELGRIDIKLQFSSDNKVQGTVIVDNPATLDLLLKDVGSLQRALQDAGLRADAGSLQFNLRGDGQAGFSNPNANKNAQNNTSPQNPYVLDDMGDTANLAASEIETYYITPGRVNLRV